MRRIARQYHIPSERISRTDNIAYIVRAAHILYHHYAPHAYPLSKEESDPD